MSSNTYEKSQAKILGQRIVFLRKEKGMTQKELADLLDMDDGSLRKIESGRTNPTYFTLLRFSKALEVSLAELFSFEEEVG